MKCFKSLFVFLCIALCFASCSEEPGYKNVIPKDANVVFSISLKDILSNTKLPEGALNKLKDLSSKQVSGSDLDKISDIVDGKQSIGIDLSLPFYFFRSPEVEAALTMKVENQEKLDEFFDLLDRQDICSKPTEKDGLKWRELMNEVTIAYNSETLMLMALTQESTAKKTIAKLFDQSGGDSFCETEAFDKFDSKKGAFRLFVNGSTVAESPELNGYISSLLPENVKVKDASLVTDFVFGNGRLDIDTEIFSDNKDAQKFLERQDEMYDKINGDFIAAPNDFLVWAGADVDGEKIVDRFKEIEGVKGAMTFLERGIDIENILKAIKGDIALSIPSVNNGAEFVLTAKTKNTDFLKDVSGWQETMKDFGYSMTENSKNNFSLRMPGESTINWGVEGDNLYFASENSFFKSAFTEKSDRLKAVADEIKGSVFYVYINPDAIANMPDFAMAKGILSKINRITFKGNNSHSTTVSLVLNNDKDYFITQVLDIAYKTVEAFLSNK